VEGPGRQIALPKSPDDLEALKEERAAAGPGPYNDAPPRGLDPRHFSSLPIDFPQARRPSPTNIRVTPLNTLWTIDVPSRWCPPRALLTIRPQHRAAVSSSSRRSTPAVVDHNQPQKRCRSPREKPRASIASTPDGPSRRESPSWCGFKSLLVEFLQQVDAVRRYPATADVAGLLRGLSGPRINGVARRGC